MSNPNLPDAAFLRDLAEPYDDALPSYKPTAGRLRAIADRLESGTRCDPTTCAHEHALYFGVTPPEDLTRQDTAEYAHVRWCLRCGAVWVRPTEDEAPYEGQWIAPDPTATVPPPNQEAHWCGVCNGKFFTDERCTDCAGYCCPGCRDAENICVACRLKQREGVNKGKRI